MSTLLIPQRGFLLGLPLAVIVFTQWWLAEQDTGEKGNEEKGGTGKRGKGKGKKQKKLKDKAGFDEARIAAAKRIPLSPFPSFPLSLPVQRMIAAGIVAGFLPLVHAHSFVVVMVVGGCIALALCGRAWLAVFASLVLAGWVLSATSSGALSMFGGKALLLAIGVGLAVGLWFLLPPTRRVRWYTFFVTALIVALPQLWWSTHQSAVDAGSFFAFEFGWDSARERYFDFTLAGSQFLTTMPRLRSVIERAPDVFWFWLRNSGLFIPATIAAIFWRDKQGRIASRRLLLFLAPFSLCFHHSERAEDGAVDLGQHQGAVLLVVGGGAFGGAVARAAVAARQGAESDRRWRCSFALLLPARWMSRRLCCGPAGIDVFDASGIQFAELIKQQTVPRAMIVHAPVHNHPVFLTGRRSLMGYPGHVWTHGLEFAPRESEIKRIYAGAPDAAAILRKYRVAYIVVGPLERNVLTVNEQFFSNFKLVGEVGGYRLYKVTQK